MKVYACSWRTSNASREEHVHYEWPMAGKIPRLASKISTQYNLTPGWPGGWDLCAGYDAMGWQFKERAHMKCYSYGHAVNYMKGGISTADRILTVRQLLPVAVHLCLCFGADCE